MSNDVVGQVGEGGSSVDQARLEAAAFDRRRIGVRGQLRALGALFGEPVASALGDRMEALEESAYDAFRLYERALTEKAAIIENLQREIERLSITLAAEPPQPIDTYLQPIDGVGPQIVPNQAIDEAATWIWRQLLNYGPDIPVSPQTRMEVTRAAQALQAIGYITEDRPRGVRPRPRPGSRSGEYERLKSILGQAGVVAEDLAAFISDTWEPF